MNSPFTRRLVSLTVFLVVSYSAAVPASAEQRLIVRTAPQATIWTGLLSGVQVLTGPQIVARGCAALGCTVRYPLDLAVPNQLFLITVPDLVNLQFLTTVLRVLPGILHVELDAVLQTLSGDAGAAPPALLDAEPIDFFGVTVRAGYVRQPADTILGISAAREQHGLTGAGITVAVIDTGVDPTHPVLSPVLLDGYDYTRNRSGGSERGDVNDSMMYAVDAAQPTRVNESTMAIVNDSMMYAVDDPNHAAFGHGTMVAGVIHLVAPLASILPLKAFGADGRGYTSDVLRAIYGAVSLGAKVLNMSFSFTQPSDEMRKALDHAMASGAVPVASAGNDGQMRNVYPAALAGVIGVASTTDYDVLSSFSNFGTEVAWIAAPGEGVVTTYPMGTYAAAWGTSFSTPFAAGAAALLAEADGGVNALDARDAEGYSIWIGPEVNRGRLDIPSALSAFITRLLSQPSSVPPQEPATPPSSEPTSESTAPPPQN
jgi:subtilisin family serine protease